MQEGCGLQIAVVSNFGWTMEVQIVAESTGFRTCIQLETNPDWLVALASRFRGYPEFRGDSFREEIGIEGYRYVAIEAFCTDSAGHAALSVNMTDGSNRRPGSALSQKAEIVIPFEPAAADEFATALQRIADERTGRAYLAGC